MSTAQLLTFAQWSAYFTLFCAAIAVLAWVLKWGIRFRLVGVTGFMIVLTGGIFALGLGLSSRPQIAGAVRFSRVFDTGADRVVIAVPPTITPTELEATLRQAAINLFSSGRSSQSGGTLLIRARTVLHPAPGVSQPLYLGQVSRPLGQGNDVPVAIELFPEQLAQLPTSAG
jgi:hypothetical protein